MLKPSRFALHFFDRLYNGLKSLNDYLLSCNFWTIISASSVVCILPPGLRLFPESVCEALVLVLQDGVDLAVLLPMFIVLSE